MIITEIITINDKKYKRSFSDQEMMIERDNVLYEDAIDPIEIDRIYTETDIKIEKSEDEIEERKNE